MQTHFKFIFTIVFIVFVTILNAQILDVRFTNIRNTKGQLCLAIFADETGFKAEKPCWEMKCSKKDIVNGELHIQIPIQEGKWGFSVLDDENYNGKMDYNLFGIPREGFGFSNYFHRGILKPAFDDFKFDIQRNETKKLFVKMKYF